jgi:hypothetical protein
LKFLLAEDDGVAVRAMMSISPEAAPIPVEQDHALGHGMIRGDLLPHSPGLLVTFVMRTFLLF